MKKVKLIYEKPVKIKRKKVTSHKWDCTFCGYILRNFSKTSGLYWCPNCEVWHYNTLALLGGQSNNVFDDAKFRIKEKRKPNESLTFINDRLNAFYDITQKSIKSKVIVYLSEDYDQEYLKSLIPSLNKEGNNEYKN